MSWKADPDWTWNELEDEANDLDSRLEAAESELERVKSLNRYNVENYRKLEGQLEAAESERNKEAERANALADLYDQTAREGQRLESALTEALDALDPDQLHRIAQRLGILGDSYSQDKYALYHAERMIRRIRSQIEGSNDE